MRLHPLSVVFRALSRGMQVGVGLFFLGGVLAGSSGTSPLFAPGLALAGVLLGLGWEVAYYRRFEYDLTSDTLDIASGVFSRRRREIPLRRVQNVDVSRGVVQRALGLAVVDFETAGGGETEANLRYVSYDEAKRLQRGIRRRKRDDEADAPTGIEAETETEERLFSLSIGNLLILSLVAPDLRVLLPVFLFAGTAFGLSIPTLLLESGLLGASPSAAALAGFSWVASGVTTFARYYDFKLTRSGDELRYERGLFSRYDGSIPLDKVQQLDVGENVLMRRFGYASLAVETAGYTPGEGPAGGSEAAIPLAKRERALALARSIDGFEFDDPDFARPPRRTRRRYAVRYALAIVLVTGVLFAANALLDVSVLAFWYVPLATLFLAPVAAHYKWLHRGSYVGPEHVITRNGFWRRSIAIVPAYRVQTIIQTATPFQRWRSLATVEIDTAGSLSLTDRGARAVDFDVREATTLRETVRGRFRESLLTRRNAIRDGRNAPERPIESQSAANDDGPSSD